MFYNICGTYLCYLGNISIEDFYNVLSIFIDYSSKEENSSNIYR